MDNNAHYLATDASVICEDEVYAVIALRIEKSAIEHNLRFLGALLNLVPGAKAVPRRPSPAAAHRPKRRPAAHSSRSRRSRR